MRAILATPAAPPPPPPRRPPYLWTGYATNSVFMRTVCGKDVVLVANSRRHQQGQIVESQANDSDKYALPPGSVVTLENE